MNYNESYEVVFKRATARCYNSTIGLIPTVKFNLLLESQRRDGKIPAGPSWVLDFTYCDSYFKSPRVVKDARDPVTVQGFIYSSALSHPTSSAEIIHSQPFVTPRTLFCTGLCIDHIHKTGVIPDLSATTDDVLFNIARFVFELIIERQSRRALINPPGSDNRRAENIEQGHKDFLAFVYFFALIPKDNPPKGRPVDVLNYRMRGFAGNHFFITASGLVGIATAPLQEGDSLCLLHTAPVYFVLREVEGQKGNAQSGLEHRIVVRAVINDRLDDMKALTESLPSRRFQIV